MNSLEFVTVATVFSLLGYGLAYLTVSAGKHAWKHKQHDHDSD